MATLPTIEINRGGHRLIINQSDYSPGVDAPWEDAAAPAPLPIENNAIQNEADEAQGQAEEATQGQVDRPSIDARLAELQGLAEDGNWRTLKAIAEGHGIARPANGWDEAVMPILVAEYGQSEAEEIYTSPEE
jgi:hypothetical protein